MQNLLLLHGALGAPVHFQPYESWLSQHFTIHTIEFAGHGVSAIPSENITIQYYVDQVKAYCKEKQLEQVHIFGYSMGGYVALALALQQKGLVASILTLATKLNWTAEGALLESRKLVPEIIEEKVPRFANQLAAMHGPDKWKQLLPAVAAMVQHLGENPLLDTKDLEALNMPVQLMVGDQDNMVTFDETLQAVKSVPDARLCVLPSTKHPIETVRPQLLTGLMKDFWKL